MNSKFKIGDKVKFNTEIFGYNMEDIYVIRNIRESITKQSNANVIELEGNEGRGIVFESSLDKYCLVYGK